MFGLFGHLLRKAGHQSVWSPACQDRVAGGHAVVGVVSLGGAPLYLPSFVTPQFQEFFRLGRVLRTTLPTAHGGVVHLFVVYGYQGAEEDADQQQLTDKLLQTVLAEAGVVCTGQPVLIAGDLHDDPALIPCLAKAISAGRFVDLALERGSGLLLLASSSLMSVQGLVGILSWVVLMRLLLPLLAGSLIGGFFHFFFCPVVFLPWWPACWIDTLDRSASSVSRAVQDAWDVYREDLGVVPLEVVDALRDAVSRSSDDFWSIWSTSAEAGLFRACCRAGGPIAAGSPAFLGRGLLRNRSRCLGGRGSRRLYRAGQGDEVDVHCSQ